MLIYFEHEPRAFHIIKILNKATDSQLQVRRYYKISVIFLYAGFPAKLTYILNILSLRTVISQNMVSLPVTLQHLKRS